MDLLINGIGFAWILDIVYKICLIFDAIIYTVGGWLFNVFYKIAGMSIVNDFSALVDVVDRLKLFIGIFALFVLVKSLIAGLIDTDHAMSEGSKIVKNAVIAVALLLLTPIIFDILNGFQSSIVNSNAIPKLVMTESQVAGMSTEDGNFLTGNNVGTIFMNNVFLLFFKLEGATFANFVWKSTTSPIANLFTELGDALFGTVEKAFDQVSNEGASILVLLPYTNSSKVYYEYPIVSGIIGIIFSYYFLKLAMNIAIRMFKLFALQVLAPIPIVLSIDPKLKNYLNSYIHYLLKVYVELFIWIFAVMLAYPLLFSIAEEIDIDSGNLILNLILMIALLKFTKVLPELLSEIFHLKVDFSGGGVKGWLGGIFGTGLGLATGAIASSKGGLKGTDFAFNTMASGVKGGVSGSKAAKKGGVIGFGGSVVGQATNSYVDATQIYSTGGYGNWLKAQMYEKTGQSKIFAQQREKLSDAVTNSTQHYEAMVKHQKDVSGLKTAARQLYDEATGGGVKNSFEYKQALERRDNAVKSNDVDAYNAANAEIERFNIRYEQDVADFYDNANINSNVPQSVTLASLKNQIDQEIRSVDSSFDLNSYSNIDSVVTGFSPYIQSAERERDLAVDILNDFKSRPDVQLGNYKLEYGNKYTASSNTGGNRYQGTGGSTGGQQGRGPSGGSTGGQQGRGPSGGSTGGQQGRGPSGGSTGGQQGRGPSGGSTGGQQGRGPSGGSTGGQQGRGPSGGSTGGQQDGGPS